VNTKHREEAAGRRRRRRHSDEFKADAVAASRQPGVSIAAVAMSRGVNANLLRRWVAEAERDGRDIAVEPRVVEVPRPTPAAPAPSFMPVALPPPSPVAAADIRVELRRGGTAITVTWPSSAAAECASWMRELLK
jgi:transposase